MSDKVAVRFLRAWNPFFCGDETRLPEADAEKLVSAGVLELTAGAGSATGNRSGRPAASKGGGKGGKNAKPETEPTPPGPGDEGGDGDDIPTPPPGEGAGGADPDDGADDEKP
jgi:hypothetical protein